MAKKSLDISDWILKATKADLTKNPKQLEFLTANSRYVLYGGARGGGKSFITRLKVILLAYKYKGIKILFLRRTLQELRENHTIEFKKIFLQLPKEIRPVYNDDEKAFTFPNGSRIKLGYCDSEGDVLQYQGQEYDILVLDEATQFTSFQFDNLDVVVRGTNDFPKRTYLTGNPGGVGHAFIYRLFIEKSYKLEEQAEDYTFIQADVYDNLAMLETDRGFKRSLKEFLEKNGLKTPNDEAIAYAKENSDYVRRLKNLPFDLREAWLHGNWNAFAGQYFSEWDYETHTVEPFEIPSHWRRSVAIDYGLDMFAVGWFAINEYGKAYMYRELSYENLPISIAADALTRATPSHEKINEYIAPPDLWNRRQDTGKSAAEIFAECGIPLIKAGNNRPQGWLNMKEWLKPIGEEQEPRLQIFRNCEGIIRDIPQLQHHKSQKDDVANEPHDITHRPDMMRYWCSLRQLSTFIQIEKPIEQFRSERETTDDDYYSSGEVTEQYLIG